MRLKGKLFKLRRATIGLLVLMNERKTEEEEEILKFTRTINLSKEK